MTDEEKLLKAKLLKALEKLYEKDGELLKIEASERSIAFRLGIYLDELFGNEEGLSVDCEYNRKGDRPKALVGKKYTYPDLIVHKRKTHKDNRMVLEIKSKAKYDVGFKHDEEKLKAFTKTEEEPYKYKIGAHIFITSKVCDIAWYKEGKVEKIDFYTINDNKLVPIDIDPIAKHYLEKGHYLAKFYLSPTGSKGADQCVHEIEEILRRICWENTERKDCCWRDRSN